MQNVFAERPKIVDLRFDKNITLDWKVVLVIIIISDDRLKYHMKIIHSKYKDNEFLMNST